MSIIVLFILKVIIITDIMSDGYRKQMKKEKIYVLFMFKLPMAIENYVASN